MTNTNSTPEQISGSTFSLQIVSKPYAPNESLLYYDGPVLMWLDTDKGRYLAVALPDEAGPWPFLLSKLDETQQANLEAGTLSLRAAYTSMSSLLLMPDYGNLDECDVLVKVVTDVPERWLPGDDML